MESPEAISPLVLITLPVRSLKIMTHIEPLRAANLPVTQTAEVPWDFFFSERALLPGSPRRRAPPLTKSSLPCDDGQRRSLFVGGEGRKDLLSLVLGKELRGGCSHRLARMRADLGALSTFSRPGRFFLHGLTLSSAQKLCNCSEYQISSSSNAFQSPGRIFLR